MKSKIFMFTIVLTLGLISAFALEPSSKEGIKIINPTPADNAENQELNLVLEWEVMNPNNESLVYDFYFGESKDNIYLVVENIEEQNHEALDLYFDTTYYWKVTAKTRNLEATSPVWSFTTKQEPKF